MSLVVWLAGASTVAAAEPAPTLTNCNPSEGPTAGGTSVTCIGSNLGGVTSVKFGATNVTSFTIISATELTAVAPAHAAGPVSITAANGDGTSGPVPFTYVAAPTVAGIAPNHGPAAGGTEVTITGTNLSGATEVKFGSENANSFTVESATKIKAHSHSGTAGETVDITVITGGGTSATSSADEYTYDAILCPAVTGISPDHGPAAGGTEVTITGTNLSGATEVKFGSENANSFTVESATKIKATPPAHAAGSTVSVTVIKPGCPPAASPTEFTYDLPAPAVTGISPDHGPAAGGTEVTITGTNLQGATFKFGANPATEVNVNGGGTSATMKTPAGFAGTVNVIASTAGGESANTAANDYTYEVPTHTLAVNKAGTGLGSVTCNGGACAFSYDEGTSVTLVASAASGSTFAGWSGAGCSGTGNCVVTMNADTAVTATFNITGGGGGGGGGGGSTPGTAVAPASATVSGGAARIPLFCQGSGPCSGILTLYAKLPSESNGKHKRHPKKSKSVLIGKASFSIAAGAKKTVRVKITNSQAKKLLQQGKTVKVQLKSPDVKSRTLELRQSANRRH